MKRFPKRQEIEKQNWLFDMDEEDKRNGIIVDVDASALPRFFKPKNDNERLLNFQAEALGLGDNSAWNGMYTLACEVALKYIKTQGKKNRHIRALSVAEKKEKAHNAVVYMMMWYREHTGFFIKKNFTGYLYRAVQRELFYKTKAESIVDFVGIEKLEGIAQ